MRISTDRELNATKMSIAELTESLLFALDDDSMLPPGILFSTAAAVVPPRGQLSRSLQLMMT